MNNFKTLYLQHQVKTGEIISKGEAAQALGITRATLENWLTGEVSRYEDEILRKICDYFNVPLSDLLEYTPETDET